MNPFLFAWYCKASKFAPKIVEKWSGPMYSLPEAVQETKETQKPAKKAKKIVIEKSIILFDVKPWGEDTNLDDLAKKILEIEQDGLLWKTEYKKEPLAFGIFKLVVGCTIEDAKVSVDDLQESIEAFEDFVQSVDIAVFNKV
eukprot:CAMPEP_0116877114 /NCGR_PEP_ID=MMETSP0463-20121206/8940_1 /TAXON_ID=181622 /ORGANISM="Strombidinopsis sp, Strain SopsisLIS2011" /LENGTH=141 /DNA_ID=CAMNT_0004524163 /DNA_START=969 /DNA_END=1394 /DNA_ORIENTATION=-